MMSYVGFASVPSPLPPSHDSPNTMIVTSHLSATASAHPGGAASNASLASYITLFDAAAGNMLALGSFPRLTRQHSQSASDDGSSHLCSPAPDPNFPTLAHLPADLATLSSMYYHRKD